MKTIKPFLLVAYLLFQSGLKAQTTGDFRSAQTSVSWSTASHWQTWDGSQWTTASNSPGNSNDVYIQAGHTVTLTASETCNSLYISTGTSSATSGGDAQLALQGNVLSLKGKLSCYFGTVNVINGSTSPLSISASATTPSAPITKSSGGLLKFVGNSRNLTNSGEWGAGATGSNSLFDVEFALNSGENGVLVSILKAANWKISSGTITAQTRIAVDNGTTGQGDLIISDGATLISSESGSGATPVISRTTSAICGTITINGILKLLGSTPHCQCSTFVLGSNSKVELARSGNQTFLGSSYTGAADLLVYKHLILSGSGTKTTLPSVTTEIGSNGSLNMAGGALAIGASGNFNVSATATTIIYCGTSAQSATSSEWNSNFQNVIIKNSAGVSLSFARTINGSLYLLSGTFSNGSNITLGNGANIIRTNGALAAAPTFGSSVNITYDSSTNNISSGHEIPTDSSVLNNLTLNNSSGVKLSSKATLNGVLGLNKGLLSTSHTNLLVLTSNATANSISSTSYVSGPIKKTGNADFVFPIGKGNRRARAALNNITASSTDYFIAEYFDSLPPSQDSLGAGLTGGRISKEEYWVITSSSSTKAQLTLFWDSGNSSGISSLSSSDLVVSGFDGVKWKSDSSKFSSGSASSGLVKSGIISNWNKFTFGSPNKVNALPVQLMSFTAEQKVNSVVLKWSTASELASLGFEIQMATDGVNFNKIGFENSKSEGGISSQKLNYEHHYFEPFTGTRFFRLKQTDFNGDFEYSNLIKVSTSPYKKQDINWHLAHQILFITLEKPMDAEIEIFNCLGKLVFSKHIATSENVNLHNIATGVYYLKVNNNKPEKILITEKNE
jgi:hypothetical protein